MESNNFKKRTKHYFVQSDHVFVYSLLNENGIFACYCSALFQFSKSANSELFETLLTFNYLKL